VCAGFRAVTPTDGETLENKGRRGFGGLSDRELFARFYPQLIMRRIANSLLCAAATFPGFER
jgi:hypothetical protein